MATEKQKQQGNFATIFGILYGFVLIAVLSYCSIVLHLSGRALFFGVGIPMTIVLCVAVVWMTMRQQQCQLHENAQFSRLIYQVKLIEQGKKKVSKEETARLKEEISAVVEVHPEYAIEANRYLGDLAFAMMDTDEALRYYTEALNKISPSSEDYFYMINRSAAGLLRVGNYQVALKEFKYIADIKPYYSVGLGAIYEFGWGVERDLNESGRLYEQATRNGNDLAVINQWENQWRQSHPIPDPDTDGYAEYMLKCHDQEGYKAGVPALTASAEAGYAPSQYELGTLYMDGNLGRNKDAEAFRWLRMGANQNYAPAMHNLGFLVQRRCMDPIKGDVNKPKIPGTLLYDDKVRWASYDAGNALILQAAEAGFAPAQHSVGCTLLRDGKRDEAKLWLKSSADQGFRRAQEDYKQAFGSHPA